MINDPVLKFAHSYFWVILVIPLIVVFILLFFIAFYQRVAISNEFKRNFYFLLYSILFLIIFYLILIYLYLDYYNLDHITKCRPRKSSFKVNCSFKESLPFLAFIYLIFPITVFLLSKASFKNGIRYRNAYSIEQEAKLHFENSFKPKPPAPYNKWEEALLWQKAARALFCIIVLSGVLYLTFKLLM